MALLGRQPSHSVVHEPLVASRRDARSQFPRKAARSLRRARRTCACRAMAGRSLALAVPGPPRRLREIAAPRKRNVDPPGNDHQRGGSRGEHERARRSVRSARRPRAVPRASFERPLARPRGICRVQAAISSENEPNRDHSQASRPPAAIAGACSAVSDGWGAYKARKGVALKYNAAQPVATSH